MKKTTKENPITTFRKNFEARSKTVMSSLKKAQNGIAVNDEMSDDLINKSGSTGGYKKPSPFSRPDANLEAEGIDKIDRLNQMYPNRKYGLPPIPVKAEEIYKKGGTIKKTIKKTIMKKSGPVKKMEDGGIFTPDGRLKSKKTRNVDTGFNPNSSVSRTKRNGEVVTKSITTSQGFVPSASKTKTITDKEGAIKSEKTKDIGWNSALRKINRVDKNAGRNKNDTYTYKTGGAAKATKFAALAKPFNKATAADRIAGAKKNASKKK
jgi:hypothetical protein